MGKITIEAEDPEKVIESIEYMIAAAIFGKEDSKVGYQHFRTVFSLVISLRNSIQNQNNNEQQ